MTSRKRSRSVRIVAGIGLLTRRSSDAVARASGPVMVAGATGRKRSRLVIRGQMGWPCVRNTYRHFLIAAAVENG